MTGFLYEAPIPTVVESEVVTLLRKGRARIERGWCRGQYYIPGNEQVCALGALGHRNSDTRGSHSDAMIWSERALLVALGSFGVADLSVVSWNDMPDRTQAEVLALFDRAIERQLTKEGA